MSFTLLMMVTAGIAAGAGYLAAKRSKTGAERLDGKDKDRELEGASKKKLPPKGKEEDKDAGTPKPSKGKTKLPKRDDLLGLPLAVGDVVTGSGSERWLSGALVLREDDRVAAVLFVAPEGSEHHAVCVFPAPRKDILWLHPIEVDTPDEPPATIEAEGLALRRKARLPVTVERRGQGAPDLGDTAIFATYDGGGRDAAVVVVANKKAHGWAGRRLDEGEYDRLGGGGED